MAFYRNTELIYYYYYVYSLHRLVHTYACIFLLVQFLVYGYYLLGAALR